MKINEKSFRQIGFSANYFAYLTDRTLINENKPQKYGTRLNIKDGRFMPLTIKDEKEVDRNRKATGLTTLKEYLNIKERIGKFPDCSLSKFK